MTNSNVWTRMVLTAALAGGLLFTFGGAARADSQKDCKRRLESDRSRIDRDGSRYGEHSRQANNDVVKMDETRQWCRDRKSDWDHSRFDVGLYIRP